MNKAVSELYAVLLGHKHPCENRNSFFWKYTTGFSAFSWPVGGVWLRIPWSLWRHHRFFFSSSCRCKHSPRQTWSSPLWSPRSAEEETGHHKVRAKKGIGNQTFQAKLRADVHKLKWWWNWSVADLLTRKTNRYCCKYYGYSNKTHLDVM